jgi:D-tyrosyl-tRNA(Tyr) deacylase
MRVVIQRVKEAKVEVNQIIAGSIQRGLLILAGFEQEDTEEDIQWMAKKIVHLRIFGDENQKMNLSVKDIHGGILIVSQFTLYASTKKGNRPSYQKAAKPDQAERLYHIFVKTVKMLLPGKVETGVFGAMMNVSLVNEGPVTIMIDSKNKE